MSDVSYAPLIRDMTWSYSRASSFDDCPYRWFLKYIRKHKGESGFFASYGTFLHRLIEKHYRFGTSPREMKNIYLSEFMKEVVGPAPSQKVFSNYFISGLNYIEAFAPLDMDILGVEKRVDFEIDGVPMVGYIDLLGKQDEKIYLVDNKSRTLSPRSRRRKPTKADRELDSYLVQLYLYSAAVKQEYGVLPHYLCFNCFRNNTFIVEPFQNEAFLSAKKWLRSKIEDITYETEFRPHVEWFKCNYLCECRDYCEYYDLAMR